MSSSPVFMNTKMLLEAAVFALILVPFDLRGCYGRRISLSVICITVVADFDHFYQRQNSHYKLQREMQPSKRVRHYASPKLA